MLCLGFKGLHVVLLSLNPKPKAGKLDQLSLSAWFCSGSGCFLGAWAVCVQVHNQASTPVLSIRVTKQHIHGPSSSSHFRYFGGQSIFILVGYMDPHTPNPYATLIEPLKEP